MPVVTPLDPGLHCIDLNFQGRRGVIASYLLEDGNERALVDTGPGSTLGTLLAALEQMEVEPDSISGLLLTHIHLDHAGAAGTLARHFPRARVYVHELGAPHLTDPTKLLASATRIYGDMMGPLWGPVEAVPQERLTVVGDGDRVRVGRTELSVLYTPGHASHHVVYFDADRRAVFVGDVAGCRVQGVHYVRPPTPPPDIDLELWSESLRRVRELQPEVLNLAHFGPFRDVAHHLQGMEEELYAWADLVLEGVQAGQDVPEIAKAVQQHADQEISRHTRDPLVLEQIELSAPYRMSVDGLRRYFKKRAEAGLPGR